MRREEHTVRRQADKAQRSRADAHMLLKHNNPVGTGRGGRAPFGNLAPSDEVSGKLQRAVRAASVHRCTPPYLANVLAGTHWLGAAHGPLLEWMPEQLDAHSQTVSGGHWRQRRGALSAACTALVADRPRQIEADRLVRSVDSASERRAVRRQAKDGSRVHTRTRTRGPVVAIHTAASTSVFVTSCTRASGKRSESAEWRHARAAETDAGVLRPKTEQPQRRVSESLVAEHRVHRSGTDEKGRSPRGSTGSSQARDWERLAAVTHVGAHQSGHGPTWGRQTDRQTDRQTSVLSRVSMRGSCGQSRGQEEGEGKGGDASETAGGGLSCSRSNGSLTGANPHSPTRSHLHMCVTVCVCVRVCVCVCVCDGTWCKPASLSSSLFASDRHLSPCMHTWTTLPLVIMYQSVCPSLIRPDSVDRVCLCVCVLRLRIVDLVDRSIASRNRAPWLRLLPLPIHCHLQSYHHSQQQQ
jgi:hypothetical protein